MKHYNISVSASAVELVVRDIRSGVTYPEFWTDRPGSTEQRTSSGFSSACGSCGYFKCSYCSVCHNPNCGSYAGECNA